MALITKNNFICPGAFLAGYALHYFNGKIIELAREKLHINADLYQGLPEEEYRQKYMDQLIADTPPATSVNAYVKTQSFNKFVSMIAFAVLEEAAFRYCYYLQKKILPPLLERIVPGFTKQSAVVISTFSFSLAHLFNDNTSKPQKNALLIHTSILGLIATIASEKLSLQAAIALHVGYNFRSWKRTYFDYFPSP